MNIISADYIYIDGRYHKEYGVAFDDKIVAVAPIKTLLEKYEGINHTKGAPNSVLYPGFINTHVHLEFSSNKTILDYGSYLPWLNSIIENRDQIAKESTTDVMVEACRSMMRSGITTIGAISSMGLDLDACIATPQRVIFFNELIGSNPQMVDALYDDFVGRYKSSSLYVKERVTPAIAIHSPYSVHPIVLKKALSFAKQEHSLLSAHFLESEAEREWLAGSKGEFGEFFDTFFGQSSAVNNIDDFLSAFDGYPTHFTHCVHAKDDELAKLAKEKHSIAHCPRSNRLLGCGRLDIGKLAKLNIPFSVATDGLSSNSSLSIFDELRAALMMHYDMDIHTLSKQLIDSVTSDAAKALKLNCGEIAIGYEADFALIELPQKPKSEDDIALWSILHTDKVSRLYIAGERYI